MSAPRLAVLLAAALLGAGLLEAAPARADEPARLDDGPVARSPQHFAFELKFGPYKPSIDSELQSGIGPYARYFKGEQGLMMIYELEYQFFQKLGSLAVGLNLGYWTKSGHSFPCKSGGGLTCVPDFESRAGDETSLQILPIGLVLAYRFDYLANNYHVPIVPYGKFGLTWSLWWINKGNGKVADVTVDGQTQHGRGGQFGLTAAAGVALQLDLLDPGAGRELDGSLGINHTYVFWEWYWYGAEGLGAKNALKIGDASWVAGLAFEF